MSFEFLNQSDEQVADALRAELARQRGSIELIASENFTSRAVMEAVGSVLTNKYAEGYPGHRYYGGDARRSTSSRTSHAIALASCTAASSPTFSLILVLRRTSARTSPLSSPATRCSA